jgi:hypothetical protein
VLFFFIAGLLYLCFKHVDHWERNASRWRPAFSSHLSYGEPGSYQLVGLVGTEKRASVDRIDQLGNYRHRGRAVGPQVETPSTVRLARKRVRATWSEVHLTGPRRRSTPPEMKGLRIKRIVAFPGRTSAYPNTSLNGRQGSAELPG